LRNQVKTPVATTPKEKRSRDEGVTGETEQN
jgi:hypothetical protein